MPSRFASVPLMPFAGFVSTNGLPDAQAAVAPTALRAHGNHRHERGKRTPRNESHLLPAFRLKRRRESPHQGGDRRAVCM